MIRRLICALVIALATVSQVPAHANLIMNGDFATGDLTGWTLASQSLSLTSGGQITQNLNPEPTFYLNNNCCGPNVVFDPLIGRHAWIEYLDLSYGTITQVVPTIAGHTYDIHYLFSPQTGGAPSPGTFLAMFGNDAVLPKNTWIRSLGCSPGTSYCITPAPPLQSLSNSDIGINTLWYLPGTYVESFTDVAMDNLTSLEFAGISFTNFELMAVSVTDITAIPEPPTITLMITGVLGLFLGSLKRGMRHSTRKML